MIVINDIVGLELLYDRYTPAMYWFIGKLTDDKKIADEILADALIQLKERQILLESNHSLCTSLLNYTYNCALQRLGVNEINLKADNSSGETGPEDLVYAQFQSLRKLHPY
ncbi:MAG: hypothetical protein ABIS01_15555 [Ferruginibacter sp.]